MSPAIVIAIVAGGVVAMALLAWIIVRAVARAREAMALGVEAELGRATRSGERVLCGPSGVGLAAGRVVRPAMAFVTDKHLVIVDSRERAPIPLAKLGRPEAARVYRGQLRGGRTWIVFPTSDTKLGISVRSDGHQQWLDAIATASSAK